MLFNAKFPVFVERATIPRHKSPKPLLHLVDTVKPQKAHWKREQPGFFHFPVSPTKFR
jgi:hypothetical protein